MLALKVDVGAVDLGLVMLVRYTVKVVTVN